MRGKVFPHNAEPTVQEMELLAAASMPALVFLRREKWSMETWLREKVD
jgi:hypothetical protein